MSLTTFEICVFILYLITVIVIGFIFGRKGKESTSDIFLAGRRLTWFVIGFSLIASSINSEQFIGEVGWGYKYGMAVANWEWLVWPAQGLLLFFFLPVYLKNRIFTIPEYLTRRFGRIAGSTFALVCMIQYLVINLPLVLYSGGFVIYKVFGLNLYMAIVSKVTVQPSIAEIESTLWRPSMLRPTEEELALGYPWWKKIGFRFTLLVLCFTVIYAVFW